MIALLLLACAQEPVSVIRSGWYCMDQVPHVRWETDQPGETRLTFLSQNDQDSMRVDEPYTCVQAYFAGITCQEAEVGMFFLDATPVMGTVPDCAPGWTDRPFDPTVEPVYR